MAVDDFTGADFDAGKKVIDSLAPVDSLGEKKAGRTEVPDREIKRRRIDRMDMMTFVEINRN